MLRSPFLANCVSGRLFTPVPKRMAAHYPLPAPNLPRLAGFDRRASGPACSRHRRVAEEHSTGPASDHLVDVVDAFPTRGQHDERPSVGPPERTGEPGAVELEPLRLLPAFTNPDEGTGGVFIASRE